MNELGKLQNTSTLKYILLYCPPNFLTRTERVWKNTHHHNGWTGRETKVHPTDPWKQDGVEDIIFHPLRFPLL